MEQPEYLQNFFLISMSILSKEPDEEMLSIDVKTLQKPDIKFELLQVNERLSSMMLEEDLEAMGT